jgi:mevalonate kinase
MAVGDTTTVNGGAGRAVNGIADSMLVNGNDAANGSLTRKDLAAKMQRKASSPMAPPFMVSAPGKVIVFGEHSVVHGKVRS